MTVSIEVEIGPDGQLRSLEPDKALPQGRAILVWQAPVDQSAWNLSTKAFAEDWLRPEEEEAWAYLQEAK